MRDNEDLGNIPPLVPDRDDVDTHLSGKRARSQEIVRPTPAGRVVPVTTWPVRILLGVLMLAAMGGAYGAYYFYDIYQTDLRQANLRISDLETRLSIVDQSAEESDNSLMEDINKTIEQYDLLWANWRANNRKFEDIQGDIANLRRANDGQDETAANNSQQIARAADALSETNRRLNTLNGEIETMGRTLTALDTSMQDLESLRGDLATVRQSLNSGDSTLLGLAGRLEYVEQSMESVNAHRLQINQSLFRLQENVEALQREMANPGGE